MAERIVVRDVHELRAMPAEYHEALIHQMLAHAEGELVGVEDYLRISAVAPNAHERKYCYEGARDEIEHYIVSSRVLAEIGIDTSYMLHQGPAERRYYPQDALVGKTTWIERGVTSLLAERAALDIIEEMASSSYRPWAAIMPQIIEEESAHVEHGRRITSEQCESNAGREAVQRVLDRMWPQVLDMFGSTDSRRSEVAVRWGIRQLSNEEARKQFIVKARTMLEPLGLVPPPDHLDRKFL